MREGNGAKGKTEEVRIKEEMKIKEEVKVKGDLRRYEDMLDLPHYEPRRHPRMDPVMRAAQFSPFAALTGYDEAVRRTGELAQKEVSEEIVRERDDMG